MRKLLDNVSQRLQGFIQQRDDVAMMLSSPATDVLPILKILEGLEEASTSDFFWSFTDNFADPKAYADAIVGAFATKHEVTRLAMEKEGMTPWPTIPPSILSANASAVVRLRELSVFSRELLPIPNGGNNVWIFFPLEIDNHDVFARFAKELLEHEFPFPWCHHLRFIIRDDPTSRALSDLLGGSPRIQWYKPDLSMEAINRSLEEEITDESLPLAERMAPLPVMAGNDFALKRYSEALEKYELLLRYHAPLNNYPMAALALNGMGEVYEKMGDLVRANESYEAALIPASHGENPPIPIFLNVVINLANLRVTEQKWQEAETYYDMAQQLATVARNAPVKISALENRGFCQQRQGKLEEAVKSWNDGSVIAAQLEDVESCRKLFGRLYQHYTDTGQSVKAWEIREQLTALGQPTMN